MGSAGGEGLETAGEQRQHVLWEVIDDRLKQCVGVWGTCKGGKAAQVGLYLWIKHLIPTRLLFHNLIWKRPLYVFSILFSTTDTLIRVIMRKKDWRPGPKTLNSTLSFSFLLLFLRRLWVVTSGISPWTRRRHWPTSFTWWRAARAAWTRKGTAANRWTKHHNSSYNKIHR